MICYKVVSGEEPNFCSVTSPKEYSVEYKMDKISIPICPDSRLFAFGCESDALQWAKCMICGISKLYVLKCECQNMYEAPRFIPNLAYYSDIHPFWKKGLLITRTHTYKHYKYDIDDTIFTWEAPGGSVMVDSIKPIEIRYTIINHNP